MNRLGRFPFKSRVPLTAWAFAGLATLLSILSSLVDVAVGPDPHVTTIAKELRHASVNW